MAISCETRVMDESDRLREAIEGLAKGAGDTRDRVLLDEAHPADIAAVARHLPLPEHAADVVEELPSEQAEKILGLMQEDKSEEVQERLDYPEHSAGRLMSPDFVAVNDHATVEQAIEH